MSSIGTDWGDDPHGTYEIAHHGIGKPFILRSMGRCEDTTRKRKECVMPRWIGALLIVSTVFAVPLASVIAPSQRADVPADVLVQPAPAVTDVAVGANRG